jgi:hypothetical protein
MPQPKSPSSPRFSLRPASFSTPAYPPLLAATTTTIPSFTADSQESDTLHTSSLSVNNADRSTTTGSTSSASSLLSGKLHQQGEEFRQQEEEYRRQREIEWQEQCQKNKQLYVELEELIRKFLQPC